MAYESSKTGITAGDGNWSGKMAEALFGVSDRYAAKAAADKETALRAEALDYNRGRDVLTDSRYDAEQQRAAKERNALTDGIKNYNSADARAEALARNPELAAYVDGIRADNMLTLDQNTVYNAMSDQIGPLSRDDLLKRTKGGTHMVMSDMPKDIALAISQGLADGSINKKDYLNAKKSVNNSIDDYVGSNMDLYRAEENSSILQNLVAAGADPAKAFAVAEGLSKQYNSKDQLTTAAVAAQKVAFAKSKYNADVAFKLYKEQNKDSKSSGVTKGNVDIAGLNSHLEVLDPGWMDKGTLRNFWQYAVDNGVNSKIAMHAVDKSVFVDRGGVGINRTKEEFLQLAKGLEAANKSGGNKDKYDEFIAKEATFVNPILQNKRAFMGGLKDLLVAPKTPYKYASGYSSLLVKPDNLPTLGKTDDLPEPAVNPILSRISDDITKSEDLLAAPLNTTSNRTVKSRDQIRRNIDTSTATGVLVERLGISELPKGVSMRDLSALAPLVSADDVLAAAASIKGLPDVQKGTRRVPGMTDELRSLYEGMSTSQRVNITSLVRHVAGNSIAGRSLPRPLGSIESEAVVTPLPAHTPTSDLPPPSASVPNGSGNQAFDQKDIDKVQRGLLPKTSNYSLADVTSSVEAFLQKNPKPEFVSMLQNLVRYSRQRMDPLLVKAIVQLTT
jgi:hypothetical protein